MRNQRFEFQGCKFTMAPGDCVNHHKGGPTDEGHWFKAFTLYVTQEGQVTAEITAGGSDCDGAVSNYTDLSLVDGQWVRTEERVYDQFAQAAGY